MNLRVYLFLSLFFIFFSCGGEKNQAKTSSVEPFPGQVNPAKPLGKPNSKRISKPINPNHEEEISDDKPEVENSPLTAKSKEISKAHFLLDLVRIQLDIKDSDLQNGNLQEIKKLVNEIKNAINQNPIDKNLLSDYLNKWNSYKGNLLLQTKSSNLGNDKSDGLVQSDDLWLIEKDILQKSLRICIRLARLNPSGLKDKNLFKKQDFQEIITRVNLIIDNYQDSKLNSLLNYIISLPIKNNKSSDITRIHTEITQLNNALKKLKEVIKNSNRGRYMEETEIAPYFRAILGNGTYLEFLENDIKNLINFAFQGKAKDQEIEQLIRKYDPKFNLSGFDFPDISAWFTTKKAEWFDKILDKWINVFNNL